MTEQNPSGSILNLPTNKEHLYWTRQMIIDKIDHPDVQKYVTFSKSYTINRNTLCVYNFFDNKIKNVYKSCIFDIEQGIIISTQSSGSLLENLVKNGIYPSYTAQKEASRRLDFNHFNSIIAGYGLYFTTRGLTTRKVDFIGLHHFKDYQIRRPGVSTFTTVPINGFEYHFEIDDCHPNLPTHINHSIYLYKALHDSIAEHLRSHTHPTHLKHSIINNEDHLIQLHKNLNFVAILNDVIEQTFINWINRLEYEIEMRIDFPFFNTRFS